MTSFFLSGQLMSRFFLMRN